MRHSHNSCSKAKIFTKLDANCGFWQIPLTQSSRLLTTFITPIGRFCFNKLPFGITSTPEYFQKRMSQILDGLEGVLCQIDDVLVYGQDEAEHDRRVTAVLKRIEAAGVTLNPDKCEFGKTSLKFLGHVIDRAGIQADPDKTSAITQMPPPTTVTELRRFLGMVNQLGKFSPNLAELTKPLRDLLSKTSDWLWGPEQDRAFAESKSELTRAVILAHYNPEAATKISADASSYGLGAVLLQRDGTHWHPIAYASRSMSETESHYAQIEKEALACTWACEKFSTYVLGRSFTIETDHKPLVPLLGTKQLHSLPPRILRFRLRLDRFEYQIVHVPGKHLYTADTLSRAPTSSPTPDDAIMEEVADTAMTMCIDTAMTMCIDHLPAGSERLREYTSAQDSDTICSRVKTYCKEGWPDKYNLGPELRPYWEKRDELTMSGNLLMCGHRIVVPESMQEVTLRKIHQGHQGIRRSRLRAQTSVWWPGLSRRIADYVRRCPDCARDTTPNKELLMPTELPDYPWQRVATDLFVLKGVTYVLIVDYFSRYPEVIKLTTTTSQSVILAMKSVFSRHGIPEIVQSDNGPQYSSEEFSQFAIAYGFYHDPSSPHFPQSNGHAERAVKTVKKLLKDADDPYLALLTYRATPLPWCGYSPAELLMGRPIRSDLPLVKTSLIPGWPYLNAFRTHNQEFKERQKRDYDERHRVRPLPEIPNGTDVWVTTDGKARPGQVLSPAGAPRSYVVDTSAGHIRRNRSQLNVMPDINCSTDTTTPTTSRSPIMTRSRTGTAVTLPDRYRS